MSYNEKLSLTLAAEYLDIPEDTLQSLVGSGWITPTQYAPGGVPIFSTGDLRNLRDRIKGNVPEARAKIRREREILENTINVARKSLARLQQICAHPAVIRTPHADTGNYDRSQDRYWEACSCPDCGKIWEEEKG